MDEIKLGQAERCRDGDQNQNDVTVTTLICQETGDHIHFPRRRPRSPGPHHAPSSPIHNCGESTTSSAATAAAIPNTPELFSVGFGQLYKSASRCKAVGEAKESPGNQNGNGRKRSPENQDRANCGGDTAETGKRFKTKYTAEQTERMREYAEKIRWRINKETGEGVEKFCTEIGVPLEKFRTWITNHKNKFTKNN